MAASYLAAGSMLPPVESTDATTSAPLDPEAEQLLQESRTRAQEPLTGPERTVELLVAGAFIAAAVAIPLLLTGGPAFSIPLAMALVGVYALASRVRFEVGPCYTVPTQLVFVPMLFLLPTALVPAVVAVAHLVAELPDYVRGQRHPQRAILAVSDSWFAVGPALVIAAAGIGEPSLADWPVFVAALAAQFTFDVAAATPREWFGLGISPRTQVDSTAWTFLVDAVLSPVGLALALVSVDQPYAFVLGLPLIGLIGLFAREREGHINTALELSDAYRGTTMVLADLVEADDEYTGLHSRTVVRMALDVADRLGLDAAQRRLIEFGALLHDIGKIAVPKEIINKAGPLTPEEWKIIKLHTVEGEAILEQVGGVLRDVGKVVRSSHERWDGDGYPDGLAGEEIPVEARVVSACDAFNAMTTDRPYRNALSPEIALAELRNNAGTQFDPQVVEAIDGLLAQAPQVVSVHAALPAATVLTTSRAAG